MKRNGNHINAIKENSTKSCSTKARDLMRKMSVIPNWQTLYLHPRKCTYSRPHSSPGRVYSKNGFQNMIRPSSSTTAVANPILSSLDVKRILFQKITDKKDELKKAFQLLDTGQNLTVSKSELRRTIAAFLLPLTREQFQDVLAQIPLTSSGSVPYLEFLSRFGGIDLNINVIRRGGVSETNCYRTLKELEVQIGEKIIAQTEDCGPHLGVFSCKLVQFLVETGYAYVQRVNAQPLACQVRARERKPLLKVFRNMKTIIKAFELIDVNKTGLVQPQELKRVLETFCLKMTDEEYKRFSKRYNINKDTAVNYNVFLKNLGLNNDLNLRHSMGHQEISRENQQAKTSRREHLPGSVLADSIWDSCSLEDIERTFCRELSKCYERVEKALSAGDPSKGGYVSLNYLKVVLDTFVYWLPRKTFLQLMKRFGLKTTSKINWKQFLTSFNEPQELEVSYMVSSKKRNSFDSGNQPYKENIITKLFRHADDSYAALKKALLIINTKPNVKMTGEELRHILNCMIVKLSDSEFKELMQILDPGGSGVVSVGFFLDLLENPKMRKTWPCAEPRVPLHLAWDSVEEMVHDAITRHLQTFYDMLQSYDLGDTGSISRSNFKKIMHMFCPFLTNEHLTKLCSKFQDMASGRILYKKFLACVRIKDLPAVSPISVSKAQSSEHFQKEQQQLDLSERTKPTEGTTAATRNMTKEEVIEKLKACIQQQDPVFRQRFLELSQEPEGKIDLEGFKKVLEDSGMPMDDTQYSLLAAKIGFKKEGMSYLDFAAGFEEGGQESTPPQTPAASKSHFFITAEECLKLFPRRLKESFQDPYAAFFKIDTDMDGIINMYDFHRLLLQLLLNLKKGEFERFLDLLGLRLSVTLNFREFQNLCEKRPLRTDDAPQRLIRTKQKVADSELACEQAHQYLVTKAKNRWTDLSKNFIETDNEGNGILRRRDIKNALYGFDIPLTPREFEKLWQSYDTEGRGYITYQEFLQKLGLHYSPSVHRPYAEDYFNFLGHFTKPQQVQEEIQELQQSMERAGPIRDKLMDRYEDISKALSTLDKSKTGLVSLCKLRRVLRECGCPLKEAGLASLLNSLGISWQDNSVNYFDFLREVFLLEKSKPSRPQSREKEESLPINFSTLNPEEIVKNIQEVVDSTQPALLKAFSALDKEDTGFVKATEFGQVLKEVCYQLSDNQYHYFLRKLRLHLTPYINWKYVLENLSSFLEETADEWAEKMPQLPTSTSPGDRDILERLHKAVASHHHSITQELENFDTMKTSTVSRDEFRAICTRHVQILTDEQFDRLWSEMPVNAKGRLKYPEFLSRFGSEWTGLPPTSDDSGRGRGGSVPRASERTRSAVSPTHEPRVGSRSRSLPCTPAGIGLAPGTQPLQNCEPVESKLRKQIQGCWRALLKDCKEKDVNKQGTIAIPEFLALVEKFNLNISKEEVQQLVVKYDLKNNGRFAYCDFIQSCVLLLKTKETSLLRRMRIQNAQKMKEAGAETSSFYLALLRIQPKILHCWRPMRRTFKSYDEGGTGLLSVADFRKVLRQYGINLSEEEFFHVLEYYDKTLSSRVAYNDFLRAFLQ